MPLIQGGPPEWIWERTPDPLKWTIKPVPATDGSHDTYELRADCGMQVMRLQFFNAAEMQALAAAIANALPAGG